MSAPFQKVNSICIYHPKQDIECEGSNIKLLDKSEYINLNTLIPRINNRFCDILSPGFLENIKTHLLEKNLCVITSPCIDPPPPPPVICPNINFLLGGGYTSSLLIFNSHDQDGSGAFAMINIFHPTGINNNDGFYVEYSSDSGTTWIVLKLVRFDDAKWGNDPLWNKNTGADKNRAVSLKFDSIISEHGYDIQDFDPPANVECLYRLRYYTPDSNSVCYNKILDTKPFTVVKETVSEKKISLEYCSVNDNPKPTFSLEDIIIENNTLGSNRIITPLTEDLNIENTCVTLFQSIQGYAEDVLYFSIKYNTDNPGEISVLINDVVITSPTPLPAGDQVYTWVSPELTYVPIGNEEVCNIKINVY